MDYAKAYRGVAHFGIWAEGAADANGTRDALSILAAGVDRSLDVDLRHDRDMREALDYLAEWTPIKSAALRAYREALAEHHPVTRRTALAAAYRALCRQAGGHVDADR